MINWSTDEQEFKKKKPQEYRLWRLTQLINYGLDGEKLNRQEIKKAWPKIKDRVSPDKRKVIEFLLWDKKWKKVPGLLPNRSNYWIWRSESHTSPKRFI